VLTTAKKTHLGPFIYFVKEMRVDEAEPKRIEREKKANIKSDC